MDEKQLQALYDAMNKRLGLGDFNQFKTSITSDDKFRKAFYDEASTELELGDYNTFEGQVKKKGILSGVGGVALQNGSQGGSSLLNGGGGGVSDLAKGVEKQTPEYKLKQLGLNVTFTPEEPINALQQPKERDFSTTQSALGLDKPQYVNLDDARDVSWLNESIDYNLGKELEKTNMSQARVNKLAQHMGGTEFGKKASDANEIKGILRYKAENNTLRDFYESRLPVPLSDNDLLVGGRHLVGQIDPASEKRNKKILEGGEELGEENDFNIKSLFADVLINNPNTPEADMVKAKELKDNLYATHPKYATAKAWDIISAYNHIKDNRSSGGFWRSRPTVGMVRRWMEEPELQEMFAGNEAAYQIFKEQLDNNFGLAQEGVPNEAVSAMVDNMRADDVAVGGFLNKIGQQAAGTFESIGNIGRSDAKRLKSMMNPSMVRGSFTGNYAMPGMSPAVQSEFFALEQKKKDGELTPEEEAKYKALSKVTGATDWIDRTLASGGDVTGQVIMQALLSKGIGWAAKPIAGMAGGLARTVNPRAISAITKSPMGVNAGLSIAATSYDQIRGQSVYNFPDDPEKQNAYTTAMLVANAVSERIFKDEKAVKAFTNAFKKDISSFIASVSARNIAKADIKKTILDKLATFGKQWAIEGGKESSEEAVVQLVDEALQSTMGAEDYDGSKAVKRITDTFLTTLLHGSLVSGLAAKANMNKNQLNKVALYQMVQQPEYYEDYIKRMGEEGNLEKSEVDEKLKILTKGAEIAASEPEKISQQGARKRAEYFTHQLNVSLNEEKLANSNDKNEQAEIQKEIKQSEEAAKEVYESDTQEQEILKKGAKDIKDPTYRKMAEDAAKSPETASQFIQEVREQATGAIQGETDLGNARNGIVAAFGNTIADFVSPPTPDLGFNEETGEPTSEAKAEQPSTGLSRGDVELTKDEEARLKDLHKKNFLKQEMTPEEQQDFVNLKNKKNESNRRQELQNPFSKGYKNVEVNSGVTTTGISYKGENYVASISDKGDLYIGKYNSETGKYETVHDANYGTKEKALKEFEKYRTPIDAEINAKYDAKKDPSLSSNTPSKEQTASPVSVVEGGDVDLRGNKKESWMSNPIERGKRISELEQKNDKDDITDKEYDELQELRKGQKHSTASVLPTLDALSKKFGGIKNVSDAEQNSAMVVWDAINDGKYQKAIEEGRMMANDAKTIIESAGLEVPKDILEKANQKQSTKVEGGDVVTEHQKAANEIQRLRTEHDKENKALEEDLDKKLNAAKERGFKEGEFESIYDDYNSKQKEMRDRHDEEIAKYKDAVGGDEFLMKGDKNAKQGHHFSSIEALETILGENEVIGYQKADEGYGGVSLTTDKNLDDKGIVLEYGNERNKNKTTSDQPIRIDFNIEKLKQDGYKTKLGSEDLGTFPNEQEVRIIKDNGSGISNVSETTISDAKKYIDNVQLNKKILGEEKTKELIKKLEKENIPYTIKGEPQKQSTKVEEQGGGLEAGKSEIATQDIENQPPNEPPKPPQDAYAGKDGEGGELPERRFTKQMLRDEEMLGKEEIAKTLNYVRQTNEMSVKEASDILNKIGVDEAKDLVINDGDIKPAVRVVLGQMVIKKYNELAKMAAESESEVHRDYYLDKAIQTATFVTEKLATEPGQTIQAFSLWSRLSPEGQLRAANQDMARQGKEKVRRREKDIKKIGDQFKKANEESANEVVESKEVNETVQKDTNEKIAKSKDKIAKIREKRAAIIKNAKNSRGNLYSVGRLTAEGVKFVGEIAKTYIEEGVANLEILVQKVVAHIEEVAGKKATDEIKKQIQEETDKTFDQADKSFLGKVLKDKNVRIAEIVKKHYTVVEKTKKSLAQKLMDDADMSQSNAQELAKKVESAFDRIATRKKRNILYKEKARFEKIHNTLKDFKKPDPKTIQDEIIKYSNLGAFESGEFLDMVSEKFGVGKIQPDQAAKLMQLAEKVQNAAEGSPKNDATEDLLAYRAKLRGNDLGETVQAVWYANTLSGYKTHEKNLISTFFQSMGELGTEMAKDPKAIPYLIAGYLNGTLRRGLTEAKHTLKTGRSPIHIKKVETPNVLERKQFKWGGYNPGNWFKYVMRFMVASDVLSFQGLKEARARQLARRIAGEEGFNTWSKRGWDRVNEILFHTKERWREAELQAEEEGLKGSAKKRRIYELMESSRPTEMTEDAYGFAAKGTFNHLSEGSLGALTNAIAGGLDAVSVGGVKPLRFIVPFTRIITNVVNNSLDYTPVGLARAARGVRGFKAFEGNQVTKSAYKELSREERKRLIAKAAIGITLTATLQALHMAGAITITGAGPDDPEKKRQLMQEGWQPYSIKIGNRWYSYQYTPLVFMTGFLGNMNDAGEYAKEGENPDFWKKMEIATSRVGSQVVDMTWINSAATFLGALSESNPASQEKKLSQAFAGMTRGAVPFGGAINQTSQAVQSIWGMPQKQVNNAWQALIADIPIARNSLNDKVNALGDPVVRDIDVITSKETADTVWKYLLDHKGWVAPVNKGTIIIYDKDKNIERPITDDEYYEFSKMRGREIKKGIEMIMNSNQIPVIRNGQTELVSGKDLKENELNPILSKLESMATKYTKSMLFNKPEANEEKEESIKEYNKMVKELLGELELEVENE